MDAAEALTHQQHGNSAGDHNEERVDPFQSSTSADFSRIRTNAAIALMGRVGGRTDRALRVPA